MVSTPPRTANQCIEDGMREVEAMRAVFGDEYVERLLETDVADSNNADW